MHEIYTVFIFVITQIMVAAGSVAEFAPSCELKFILVNQKDQILITVYIYYKDYK